MRIAGLAAGALLLGAGGSAAQTLRADVSQSIDEMSAAAGVRVQASRSSLTGLATFVSVDGDLGIPVKAAAGASAEVRARAFLASYGHAFGIRADAEYTITSTQSDAVGMDHVRVRQVHRGVPITAGEMYVHLKGSKVLAANGKTLDGLEGLDVTPAIQPADAAQRGLAALEQKFGLRNLETTTPRLEILNRGLLEGRRHISRLTWFFEARRMEVRQFVWVDAKTGSLVLNFSQLTTAKNRTIYNGNGLAALPGTLMRNEGGPATGDPDADKAYDYSGHTYDYFLAEHGRDSWDGAGGPLISTVHHCPTNDACNYPNAFWNGTQMVYGNGFSLADDVDAHELTHAVTEKTAGLFYYMQSGALNESFSDIFGETVDLTNGAGNDAPGVRWQMGEEVPGLGAIRNMMTPTLFSDPGKMSDSAFLKCDNAPFYQDQGGVHSNSGIPNHAFALMVDGGTYNGITVSPIGLTKAGKIQYRVLSRYLTSGSDFLENYNGLKRACADLLGVAGITTADCTEVTDALNAVQMGIQFPCPAPQALVPAFCPANQTPLSFYMHDMETAILSECPGGSAPTTFCRNGPTSVLGAFATSATHSLWGYNRPDAITQFLTVPLPPVPPNARFQFNHSFGFENDSGLFYDGGVLDISTNSGSSYSDAAGLFIGGGATYGGTISTCCSNPLGGRSAFVASSWGYTATQVNLAGAAGMPTVLKFSIGTDESFDDYGWFLDDFRGYTCVSEAPPRFDFDTDRKADLVVYHQATGLWYRRNSSTGVVTAFGYGGPGYTAVAGDYDGDNITDEAVFHASTGLWFIHQSSTGTTFSIGFGTSAYIPVARDYDGDGKTDIAIYHPPTGLWYYRSSITTLTVAVGYGGTGYNPIPADYDGDGKADMAVFHAATGIWFIKNSSTGLTTSIGFGTSAYTLVPADYDGDGKTDIAVYHPPTGNWYWRGSYTGTTFSVGFGGTGYTPVPGDYDGDGKADPTVYHPTSTLWFVRQSLNGMNHVAQYSFGGTGFAPVY